MKEVQLTRGYVAIVDDEDYEHLSQHRWQPLVRSNTVYVQGAYKKPDGSWSMRYMHRLLLQAPTGVSVDHIDGNGLNNQRSNLRLATHGQNMHNKARHRNNTSGYVGVSWHKSTNRWFSSIKLDGRKMSIGYFDDLVEAAKARDEVAKELHGEFARLNFPEHQAQYEYCELTEEFDCPQPMDKPASRCELCTGCLA